MDQKMELYSNKELNECYFILNVIASDIQETVANYLQIRKQVQNKLPELIAYTEEVDETIRRSKMEIQNAREKLEKIKNLTNQEELAVEIKLLKSRISDISKRFSGCNENSTDIIQPAVNSLKEMVGNFINKAKSYIPYITNIAWGLFTIVDLASTGGLVAGGYYAIGIGVGIGISICGVGMGYVIEKYQDKLNNFKNTAIDMSKELNGAINFNKKLEILVNWLKKSSYYFREIIQRFNECDRTLSEMENEAGKLAQSEIQRNAYVKELNQLLDKLDTDVNTIHTSTKGLIQ